MSSIPVRRTTRTTRATRDNENANARPSRALTARGKALAAGATGTAVPTTSRATAATATSKANATTNNDDAVPAKRKREVLVEVTGLAANNKPKAVAGGAGKGKGKETVDEVPVKAKATVKVTRASTRTVAGLATRRITRAATASFAAPKQVQEPTVSKSVPEQEVDANVMDIDPPKVLQSKPDHSRQVLAKREEDADEVHRVFKKRHMEAPPQLTEEHLHDESQLEADKIAADLVKLESEAEPAEQLWDDLDADDWDDPVMVSEYVGEICEYWKEIEVTTMPNADYMKFQNELTWDHRGVLVDWILQVHAKFQLLPESLFLCINVLDRFLSARPISLAKLQLVGLACFFIATKFEEMYAPSVAELAFLSDDQYSAEEILKAERYILRTIDWDLRAPGPMGWLRRGSKADDCEVQARTVAKYFLEIAIVEWRLLGTLPSLIAATALWLARLTLGREEWTPNLAYYTTFTEEELLSTANTMLEYIVTNPMPHQSLYKKYASKRFFRCSAYIRHWALQRWPENGNVDLKSDLEFIKSEIRRERESEPTEKAEESD